jgi:hypothetical protein
MFPPRGPDPVLRPPLQTPIRVIEFLPGASPPQPDDVTQTVVDAGAAYYKEVAVINDSSMFPPELLVPPPE